jgi:hypothetical protein
MTDQWIRRDACKQLIFGHTFNVLLGIGFGKVAERDKQLERPRPDRFLTLLGVSF